MKITASILYDLVECPQRVARDAFGDATSRDEINAFVRLLWERGTLFEKETIANLRLPFVDLSDVPEIDRERVTFDTRHRLLPCVLFTTSRQFRAIGHRFDADSPEDICNPSIIGEGSGGGCGLVVVFDSLIKSARPEPSFKIVRKPRATLFVSQ